MGSGVRRDIRLDTDEQAGNALVLGVKPGYFLRQETLKSLTSDAVGLQLAKSDPEGQEGRVGYPVAHTDADEDDGPLRNGGNGALRVASAYAVVPNDIEYLAQHDGKKRLETGSQGGRGESSGQGSGVGPSGEGEEVFPLRLLGLRDEVI